MKTFSQWFNQLMSKASIKQLIYVILVLLIVLLLSLTWGFWSGIYGLIMAVLKPFIFGFIFAYLLRPAVLFFEKHKIKRGISVPLIVVGVILAFVFLFASFLPKLLTDLGQLAANFGDGIEAIYELYIKNIDVVPSPIIKNVFDQIVSMSDNLFKTIPNLPIFIGDSLNTMISWFTTIIFSFVIGLYFIMDYEKVGSSVLNFVQGRNHKLYASMIAINQAVRTYLSSLMFIMVITFAEYTLFYTLVGHKYALVMGLLCAVSLLVPYVGGMAMNVLGFISGLGLKNSQIMMIFLGLLILPNIDSYFISPLVYKKRNKTNPLWSLFSFFACATIFGFVGVFLSMPLYFSIRAILNLKKHDWSLDALSNDV